MRALLLFLSLFFGTFLFAEETVIILARHGETDWNVEKKVQGHTDIPLNLSGQKQAKKLALQLKLDHSDIKAIYSSDLSRAYQTAQETASLFDLPIHQRFSLREINAGSSEGMKVADKVSIYKSQWKELKSKYPDKRERWKFTPVAGEETIHEMLLRLKKELTQIGKQHLCEKVIIFTHGKAIQSLLADILDCEMEGIAISNCETVQLVFNPENIQVPFRIP